MVQGQAQGTFQVRGRPGARVRGAGTAVGAEATWPSQQPESWSLWPRGPCPQSPAHSSCTVNTHGEAEPGRQMEARLEGRGQREVAAA